MKNELPMNINGEIFYLDKRIIRYIYDEKAKVYELEEIISKTIEYIHNHQLVFELSSKEQIQEWFDKFYAELLNILRGEDNE